MNAYGVIKTTWKKDRIQATFVSELLLLSSKYDIIIQKSQEVCDNIQNMLKKNSISFTTSGTEQSPNDKGITTKLIETSDNRMFAVVVSQIALEKTTDDEFRVNDIVTYKDDCIIDIRKEIGTVPKLMRVIAIDDNKIQVFTLMRDNTTGTDSDGMAHRYTISKELLKKVVI